LADDLILALRNETLRAADNISNIEVIKITALSRNNNINFNEDKFKVMIISRKKRKENKEINIYFNNKPLNGYQRLSF
jgi:hypothetical protein